jgi:chromosome segregation ATPase
MSGKGGKGGPKGGKGKGKGGKGKGEDVNPKELAAREAAQKVNDIDSDEIKYLLGVEYVKLKEAVDNEDRMLGQYQQEREKLNYNWIISKKELEDQKGELINKDRELGDLKENHMMTLNLFKQKVKHLLFQNQDNQTALKKDVEVTLKQLEDEHRIGERELKFDNRALNMQVKEQEVNQNEYMFALKTEYDRNMTQLRQDYERVYNDVKAKYHLKMQKLRAEMEETRARMIKQIEDKKDLAIKNLTQSHAEKYSNIKNYYSDITATNLDLIKQLKSKINELQKEEDSDRKLLAQIEAEAKNLNDPLNALNAEILRLTEEMKEYEKLKKEKDRVKDEIEQAELEFRRNEFEYEVKLQQFKYLERETNALSDKFNEAVYEIQRKTGLKNLILEKQVAFITDNIEIRDLQLNQVITSSNIDPKILGEITRSIEEVESAKDELIQEYQKELQQIRKAHTHMVKAYEGKLAEFVIPVEELGFDPLVPTNTE